MNEKLRTISPSVIETLSHICNWMRGKRVPVFLVGGLLRDQLLGRVSAVPNVDLAVAGDALTLAREMAESFGAAYVPLDEEERTARIVLTLKDGEGARRLEIDISALRGRNLEEDLSRRDFTINAIAISLEEWLKDPLHPKNLTDPLAGVQAIKKGALIACSDQAFAEDPLRILRGVRLAAQLEWTLDSSLEARMRLSVKDLDHVSAERIREEWLSMCETNRAGDAMDRLNVLGVIDIVIPELVLGRGMDQGPFHHLDVLAHEIEAVHQADRMLEDLAEFSEPLCSALTDYRDEVVSDQRTRKALIKFSTLVHDVGKPANKQVHDDGEIWFIGHEHTGAELVSEIVSRLKFSNRESEIIVQLVRHHLRPGFLSREPELTRRAVHRFYKELGDNGPACGLAWWADRMATRGPQSRVSEIDQQRARLEELLNPYFFQAETLVKPPRLVDGHKIMEILDLAPGSMVGRLLAVIEEAQAEGSVTTTEEALALARRVHEQRTKDV